MARMARLYVPGCAQHVIQRGNDRAACFHQRNDYLRYLEYLQSAAELHAVAIHAYVLMTNHVHLLLTPDDAGACGRMMQSLGRRYVRYFNNAHGRTGTLWEGRYKSTLVDTDSYFFTVCRYIELNPVRAGIVQRPQDYPWSSYLWNAQGETCSLLTPHPLYVNLGQDPEDRQRCYRAMFDQCMPEALIEELRRATNQAWAFGGDSFMTAIADTVNRRAVSRGWGGDRKSEKS